MAVTLGEIGAFTLLIFLNGYKKSCIHLRMWDFFCTFVPKFIFDCKLVEFVWYYM